MALSAEQVTERGRRGAGGNPLVLPSRPYESAADYVGNEALGIERPDSSVTHTDPKLSSLAQGLAEIAATTTQSHGLKWEMLSPSDQIALGRMHIFDAKAAFAIARGTINNKGKDQIDAEMAADPILSGLSVITQDMVKARGLVWDEKTVYQQFAWRKAVLTAYDNHLAEQQALIHDEQAHNDVTAIDPNPIQITVDNKNTGQTVNVSLTPIQKEMLAYLARFTQIRLSQHRDPVTGAEEMAALTQKYAATDIKRYLFTDELKTAGFIETTYGGSRLTTDPDTLMRIIQSDQPTHAMTTNRFKEIIASTGPLIKAHHLSVLHNLSTTPTGEIINILSLVHALGGESKRRRIGVALDELAELGIVTVDSEGKYRIDEKGKAFAQEVIEANKPITILVGVRSTKKPVIEIPATNELIESVSEIRPDEPNLQIIEQSELNTPIDLPTTWAESGAKVAQYLRSETVIELAGAVLNAPLENKKIQGKGDISAFFVNLPQVPGIPQTQALSILESIHIGPHALEVLLQQEEATITEMIENLSSDDGEYDEQTQKVLSGIEEGLRGLLGSIFDEEGVEELTLSEIVAFLQDSAIAPSEKINGDTEAIPIVDFSNGKTHNERVEIADTPTERVHLPDKQLLQAMKKPMKQAIATATNQPTLPDGYLMPNAIYIYIPNVSNRINEGTMAWGDLSSLGLGMIDDGRGHPVATLAGGFVLSLFHKKNIYDISRRIGHGKAKGLEVVAYNAAHATKQRLNQLIALRDRNRLNGEAKELMLLELFQRQFDDADIRCSCADCRTASPLAAQLAPQVLFQAQTV